MREVLIGHVGVDSGQMMLCDPCYIKDSWEKREDIDFDNLHLYSGDFNYGGACEATLSKEQSGILSNGLGAVCSTGYGDGMYPVYVRYNNDGRVAEMRIVFDVDDEFCFECDEPDGYCECD